MIFLAAQTVSYFPKHIDKPFLSILIYNLDIRNMGTGVIIVIFNQEFGKTLNHHGARTGKNAKREDKQVSRFFHSLKFLWCCKYNRL